MAGTHSKMRQTTVYFMTLVFPNPINGELYEAQDIRVDLLANWRV
jgi:hypothetical protein